MLHLAGVIGDFRGPEEEDGAREGHGDGLMQASHEGEGQEVTHSTMKSSLRAKIS